MSLEAERQLVAEHSPDCESHPGETTTIAFHVHRPFLGYLFTVVCCDGAVARLREYRSGSPPHATEEAEEA